MTLIVVIDADFSWNIRVYHNYLRHLRSIVFVVYFLHVTLIKVIQQVSFMWIQKEFILSAKNRGFHLITDEIISAIPELRSIDCGLLHLFIKHTSSSLTINENADPTVRQDLESHFNQFVPEKAPYYRHDYEGDDDMPAHIKSCLLGCSVSLPITNGALNIGIWQGIYLCEHRNQGGRRAIVATIQGKSLMRGDG